MVSEHCLEVKVGEDVGIHDEDVVMPQSVHKRKAAHRPEAAWLLDAYCRGAARHGEMFLQLLFEVVDGDEYPFYAVGFELVHIVVYYGFPSDFEKGLGSLQRQGAQAFATASCHHDGIERKHALGGLQVDDALQAAF